MWGACYLPPRQIKMKKLTLQEYIREKNLCAILEQECTNEFVVKIDEFFNELFTDLKIYTDDNNHNLIFMKGDKYIMTQDFKGGYLGCRYDDFWLVLEKSFSLRYEEIQAFISHMVEEAFKMGSLTPIKRIYNDITEVEESFKMGSLKPKSISDWLTTRVEEYFQNGLLKEIR